MSNVLGTSFATAGFSYDPNLSPNNQSFSYAVRAVLASAGITWNPPITLTASTITVNGTLVVNGTSTFNGNVVITGTAPGAALKVAAANNVFSVGTAASAFSTSTTFNWGNNTANIQIASAGGLAGFGAANEVDLMAGGVYWDGTRYNHGSAGTAVVLILSNGTAAVYVGTAAGTAGQQMAVTQLFSVAGTAGSATVQCRGPVAGAMVDMTCDSGTFTGTFGGFTTAITGVAYWSRSGNNVTLLIPYGTGSSNSTTTNFAPIPVQIQSPTRRQICRISGQNAGVPVPVWAILETSGPGTMTLDQGEGANLFTGSGVKIIGFGPSLWMPISYSLV